MVEKLLTNWMSICLYTFVRVRAGGSGPLGYRVPSSSCTLPTTARDRTLPNMPVYFRLLPEALTAHTFTGLRGRASVHALPRD